MGATYLMKCAQCEVVHLDPDGSTPVVFTLTKERVVGRQATNPIRRPEALGIVDEIEDVLKVRRRRLKKAEEEGEERDIAGVANMFRVV